MPPSSEVDSALLFSQLVKILRALTFHIHCQLRLASFQPRFTNKLTIKADSDVLVAIFHLNFESINKHPNEEPCIFQWVSAGESAESAELAK